MAAPKSEEIDFPRGGASILTPLEHRQISIKAANDLFKSSEKRKESSEEPAVKKRRKTDKKKAVASKKENKPTTEKHAPIDRLSLKDLNPETLMTGCITKIKDLELIVALPSQIIGVVPITEISEQVSAAVERVAGDNDNDEDDDDDDDEEEQGLPSLYKLFRVGQFVQCRVVRVEEADLSDKRTKTNIELTLRPEAINRDVAKVDASEGSVFTASVKSAEDHGYILSLGIDDITAFCNLKEAESYINEYNNGEPLVPGQIVQCIVKKTPKKDQRTVNVTLDSSQASKAVVKSPASTLHSIVPGLKVNGTIKAVQPKGMNITFMGLYDATIDISQIPNGDVSSYNVGDNITFRVLFCSPSVNHKMVGGTLLPHLLTNNKNQAQQYAGARYPRGTLLEQVKVVRVARNKGLYMTIKGDDNIQAFASVNNISDDRIENVVETSTKYGVDTVHNARVLSYSPMEDVLSVTLKKSVIEEKYGNVGEIEIGDMIEGTVQKFNRSGLLLNISSGIIALVPVMHYADAALQQPELKYKPGNKVRGRVLERDLDNSRILVSLKQTLIDSPLPRITSWETAKSDMVTHAVIQSVRPNGAILRFYGGMTGFVPASQMTEARGTNLASAFRIGQPVKAYIYAVNQDQRRIIASLTNVGKIKKQEKDARKKEEAEKYTIGKIVPATIKSVKEMQLNLEFENGRHGRVAITEAFTDISQVKDLKRPLGQFKNGDKIDVKILGVRNTKNHGYLPITRTQDVKEVIECSLKLGSKADSGRGKVGEKYLGVVTKIAKKHVDITVGAQLHGLIRKQFTSSDPVKATDFQKEYTVGQMVPVELVILDRQHHTAEFVPSNDKAIPRINNVKSVKVGMIGLGLVQRITRHQGMQIQIAHGIHGRVHRTDLVDTYSSDPLADYKDGMVVRYAVIATNYRKNQFDLSLRSCRIDPKTAPSTANPEINSIKDIEADQVLWGYVSNVADTGVFVSLGRNVTARIKIGYLSDEFVKDWKKLYSAGQLVKCRILHVDAENNRVEGALNKSRVGDKKDEDGDDIMDELSSDDDLESEEEEEEEDEEVQQEDEEMQDVRDIDEDMGEAAAKDNGDESSDSDNEDTPVAALGGKGFDWSGTVPEAKQESDDESDEDDSDDEQQVKKKKKGTEKQVEDKTAELSSTAPQSAGDYERVLVGSPNSSFLWINYMAYQLQLSEIEKAREIGNRALNTISFREEQEKMNVWMAMLNLENTYGSDESLEEVFKRSCVYCDPEKMHMQLAEMYERTGKTEKAQALLEESLKKFSQNPKFWTHFGLFYLKNDNVEGARELLQRCVKVLPKHHHVETISKFAQMEFKHGEPERGRTIFEGLLSSYPKRIDIWSVYVDMEIKAGDQETIRRLFERLTSMKVSSKKMKFFFKKWLQYEKEHGSEEDAERVKEKALDYVNSADRA
ncbi:nucleic acid-binding protein [Lichtheimia hyalospora FSU 10163]|nr:nucleic acid-binding protein [Lichtheimia hyalospora FSU 10163]